MADETIFGKYRLLAELGHGGMADVFLAVMQGPAGMGFSKLVVVKRLRPNLVEDPEFVAMLLDEARIAARLNHPNVVQTLEVGKVEDYYFIAMEYLEGQPLHRIQARGARQGGFQKEYQYRVLVDVLGGLQHAHDLRDYDGVPLEVVHRDVSPHNVFVTYEGVAKIVDFGIAKAVGRASETRTGIIKGKVTYMAPEQAIGNTVDRRADIFSVGVMLWEVAADARMWKGQSDVAIMHRLITGEIPASPRAVVPTVPEEIDRMCQRALAVKPEDRYGHAEEFRADLEAYLDATGVKASQRDVGARVSQLYQDKRDQIRSIIESRLAQINTSASFRVQPLTTEPASMSNPIVGTPAGGGVDIINHESTRATVVAPAREGSRKRSRARLVTGFIALAAIAGGAGLMMRGRPQVEAAPEKNPGLQQALTTEPAGAQPAAHVSLTLKAKPLEAHFTIDDGPTLENPFIQEVPNDGAVHRVRIFAPGYIDQIRELTFREDMVLEVALDKEAEKRSARAVRPPPAPPSTTPPPKPTGSTRPKRVIDTENPIH